MPGVKYKLHHAYIREDALWPTGIPRQVGADSYGCKLVHMAGRDDGTGLDIWWTTVTHEGVE